MATEQRINLKFLVRLGKTPSDALGMLQEVYGDETMSRSRVFEWHKRFKEGHEDVEDNSRSGRPSTSRTVDNVECMKQMVRGDCRLTVRMIADKLEINRDSVWKIITEESGMRKICVKMMPKLLDDDQKKRRVEVCRTFSSISKLSQTCCRESSLVMSLVSSSLTRRPSARAFSGSVRRHRGQRKQDSRVPKSSSC